MVHCASSTGPSGSRIAVPTAALVLLEILVLLGGVVSRYAFHHPIIWTDELASTLFLWLAMLGSAVALHRAEHMRMTAFVGMLSPPRALGIRPGRDRRGPDIPAAHPPLRLRFRDGRDPGDDAGDAGFGCLARSGVAGWLRHHDHDRHNQTSSRPATGATSSAPSAPARSSSAGFTCYSPIWKTSAISIF